MTKRDLGKHKICSWNIFSTWEKLNSMNFDIKKENPQSKQKTR